MKARMSLAAALVFVFGLTATFHRPAAAGFIPVAVTGFNQDVVVEKGAVNDPTTHFTDAVTATMDNGTARTFFTWYESGLPGGEGGGLPGAVVVTSEADPQARFLLAPYTGPNALFLDQDDTSGTLTFATPTAFHSLSILTSSGLGSPVLALTIHFADGTPSLGGLSVVSPDWFNNGPAALIAGGRVNVGTGDFDSVGTNNPRIYQEDVLLPSSAFNHPIASITFDWSASSTASHTAIFAVSGSIPEPSSAILLATGVVGGVWVVRRRRPG